MLPVEPYFKVRIQGSPFLERQLSLHSLLSTLYLTRRLHVAIFLDNKQSWDRRSCPLMYSSCFLLGQSTKVVVKLKRFLYHFNFQNLFLSKLSAYFCEADNRHTGEFRRKALSGAHAGVVMVVMRMARSGPLSYALGIWRRRRVLARRGGGYWGVP